MTFERQHGDLNVVITRDREGRIAMADLEQSNDEYDGTTDVIPLNADQLYALVDDVATADPETWAKRFPYQEEAELALRRVANYFLERAVVNRKAHLHAPVGTSKVHFGVMADTFDLARTRCLEEIENLYEPKDHVCDPDHDPVDLLNQAVARRR